MTAKILSAAQVVEQTKENLIKRCEALKSKGLTPSMCVVLVGNNPASLSYIKNKRVMCEKIGAKFELLQLPEDVTPEKFLAELEIRNRNPNIHGMIVQLPVPDQLKGLDIPNLVTSKKDIDGFHGLNTQHLYSGSKDLNHLMPCTPKGIVKLLQFYNIDITGKNVVVVGRSLIVGKPLSLLLTNFEATVTLAHSKTKNIREFTRQADIVVAAIGKAHFFDSSYFNPDRKTVVIDVGMNVLNGKLTGDVNQADISEIVGGVTPVPGGVGPMTVISLIDNLISATEKQAQG